MANLISTYSFGAFVFRSAMLAISCAIHAALGGDAIKPLALILAWTWHYRAQEFMYILLRQTDEESSMLARIHLGFFALHAAYIQVRTSWSLA